MEDLLPSIVKLLQIVWINIILSGDNAVVIAMACRGLRPDQRRIGMMLGSGVAVAMRVIFTLLIVYLLTTPFLKVVGSLLLLWIAVKLLLGEDDAEGNVSESNKLWHAVRTVAVADAVMSLDNVLAIAAVAEGSTAMLIAGLVISVPLIVAGAALIMALLERFPVIVWAGAALLGWVAGQMFVSDPWLVGRLGADRAHNLELPAEIVGAIVVVAVGYVLSRRAQHRPA